MEAKGLWERVYRKGNGKLLELGEWRSRLNMDAGRCKMVMEQSPENQIPKSGFS